MLNHPTNEIAIGSKLRFDAPKEPSARVQMPKLQLTKIDEDVNGEPPPFSSPTAGGLDFGDIDLAHVHHRDEGAFTFGAAGRQK